MPSSRQASCVNYLVVAATALLLSIACGNLFARAQDTTKAPLSSASVKRARERDKIIGLVRRVRIEKAKISTGSGKSLEEQRVLAGTVTYDLQGQTLDSSDEVKDDVAAATTGKEDYLYDEKGNVFQKIARSSDGSIISTEIYQYVFDATGNWIKRIAFVTATKGNKSTLVPIEATYRAITYYYGQPSAATSANSSTSGSGTVPLLLIKDSSPTENPSLKSNSPVSTNNTATITKPSVSASTPTDAAAYNKMGISYYASGKHKEAVEAFNQALQLNPDDPVTCSRLGLAYTALHRYKDAAAAFEKAIRLKPEFAQEVFGLAQSATPGLTNATDETASRPRAAFLTGAVARPDIVAADGHMTLLSAVQSLGGTIAGAQRDKVKVLRIQPNSASRQLFIINLTNIEQGRVGDVILQPGDIVEIPSDAPTTSSTTTP